MIKRRSARAKPKLIFPHSGDKTVDYVKSFSNLNHLKPSRFIIGGKEYWL